MAYSKENLQLLQEREKFQRPLGVLETLTLDIVTSDDQRLQLALYFCSILRFTLLPCYGNSLPLHPVELAAICLYSTSSFLNCPLNNTQQGCFILCMQPRLQLHQHFKFNYKQDKYTFRNTTQKLRDIFCRKNMQIISAFLLGSNKILLLKSYFIYIPPCQVFSQGLLNHSAAPSTVNSIRGRFKRDCNYDLQEQDWASKSLFKSTEFWKLVENRSLNCLQSCRNTHNETEQLVHFTASAKFCTQHIHCRKTSNRFDL